MILRQILKKWSCWSFHVVSEFWKPLAGLRAQKLKITPAKQGDKEESKGLDKNGTEERERKNKVMDE